MTRVYRWCVLLTVVCLASCSSSLPPIQYYLLHTPDDTVNLQTKKNTARVWLADLTVSDYLLQRGLALQQQENLLHISNQHIWAEPFEAAFKKKLAHSLSIQKHITNTWKREDADVYLDLHLLHLVATHQGDVVINAEYVLQKNAQQRVTKQFSTRLSLQSNGYSHAVSKYRQAIDLLAENIQTSTLELL